MAYAPSTNQWAFAISVALSTLALAHAIPRLSNWIYSKYRLRQLRFAATQVATPDDHLTKILIRETPGKNARPVYEYKNKSGQVQYMAVEDPQLEQILTILRKMESQKISPFDASASEVYLEAPIDGSDLTPSGQVPVGLVRISQVLNGAHALAFRVKFLKPGSKSEGREYLCTANHCLPPRPPRGDRDVVFLHGPSNNAEASLPVPVERTLSSNELDFALLTVETDIFTMFGMKCLNVGITPEKDFRTRVYTYCPDNFVWQSACGQATDSDGVCISHGASTGPRGGASGSPIERRTPNGQLFIVGIHLGFNPENQKNYGVSMDVIAALHDEVVWQTPCEDQISMDGILDNVLESPHGRGRKTKIHSGNYRSTDDDQEKFNQYKGKTISVVDKNYNHNEYNECSPGNYRRKDGKTREAPDPPDPAVIAFANMCGEADFRPGLQEPETLSRRQRRELKSKEAVKASPGPKEHKKS
jgi:hypothetical protein